MKYRRKFTICSLLAGLTALIVSCAGKGPSIDLLHSAQFNFPSASAIEFYKNKLYIFGDDATQLLIVSTNYQLIDTVRYWQETVERISKKDKPDIEAAMILDKEGKQHIVAIGSMSGEKRWDVFEFDPDSSSFTTTNFFTPGTRFAGIDEINIEGACLVQNTIVFANRANKSHHTNYLILWNNNNSANAKKLLLPANKTIAGISGLYYVKEKDLLLFTASEEDTGNAISDGAIGDSYLGWIEGFSKKMESVEFAADQLQNLSDAAQIFSKQKVESVCVENIEGDELLLHLAADNDNGRSRLFKVRLRLDE